MEIVLFLCFHHFMSLSISFCLSLPLFLSLSVFPSLSITLSLSLSHTQLKYPLLLGLLYVIRKDLLCSKTKFWSEFTFQMKFPDKLSDRPPQNSQMWQSDKVEVNMDIRYEFIFQMKCSHKLSDIPPLFSDVTKWKRWSEHGYQIWVHMLRWST